MLWSTKNKAKLYCNSSLCIKLVPQYYAVLAINADGRRAIIVIDREGVEIILFSFSLLFLIKPVDDGLVQPLPRRLQGVVYARPSKPCRWRGKWLRHGGDVCVLVFS
jgi:hypothetical protein